MGNIQRFSYVILASFIITSLVLVEFGRVSATAGIGIKFIKYTDNDHKLKSGTNCDYYLWARSCSPRFQFCIGITNSLTCETASVGFGPYSRTQSIDFTTKDELIGGIKNPVRYNISEWTEDTRILMTIYQSHTLDIIATVDYDLDTGTTLYQPARSEADAKYTSRSFTNTGDKARLSIAIQFKVWCHPDFYGTQCDVYCHESNDDVNGHYTCTDFGEIICKPGWTNIAAKCTERISICVSNNPCENGAGCHSGTSWNEYTCICTQGFKGKNCTDRVTTSLMTSSTRHFSTSAKVPSTTTYFPQVSTPRSSREPTKTTQQWITSHFLPTTTKQPIIIPEWPLLLVGYMTSSQTVTLKNAVETIILDTYPGSLIFFEMTTKKAQGLDDSYVTVAEIKVRINGQSLPSSEIMRILFWRGINWLNSNLPVSVYIGKWKPVTDSNTGPKPYNSNFLFIIVGVVTGLVIVSLLMVFLCRSYIRRKKIAHARVIDKDGGIQFTPTYDGYAVKYNRDSTVEFSNPNYGQSLPKQPIIAFHMVDESFA